MWIEIKRKDNDTVNGHASKFIRRHTCSGVFETLCFQSEIKYLWVGRFLWKSARNCPLVEKHFPNSFYLHKIFPEKPVEYIIGIFFKVVNSIACRNRRHTKIMHFHQKKKKKRRRKKFPSSLHLIYGFNFWMCLFIKTRRIWLHVDLWWC